VLGLKFKVRDEHDLMALLNPASDSHHAAVPAATPNPPAPEDLGSASIPPTFPK
jgi:hypothetical protein